MKAASLTEIFTFMAKSQMGRRIWVDYVLGLISESDLRISHRQLVFYTNILRK